MTHTIKQIEDKPTSELLKFVEHMLGKKSPTKVDEVVLEIVADESRRRRSRPQVEIQERPRLFIYVLAIAARVFAANTLLLELLCARQERRIEELERRADKHAHEGH
jgi:hypothetical protein